jgi:hypothetical protein
VTLKRFAIEPLSTWRVSRADAARGPRSSRSPPRPAFSLFDRDAAPLRFLRALVITCEAAALGLAHDQLAIPPVLAGESFRSLQLPDDVAVMFPTIGVLALAAILTLAGNPTLSAPIR